VAVDLRWAALGGIRIAIPSTFSLNR